MLVGGSRQFFKVFQLRTIDLFCGAGGSSWGARLAGAEIVAGCDLSPVAGRVYSRNFPEARFFGSRLEEMDPHRLIDELGPIDLLLASPECTNHSPAKGAAPRCELSKETAFQVTRYAEAFEPRWMVIENVVSMRKWSRYREFVDSLEGLGYHTSEHILDSSHFGVPQTRRRLFILCDRKTPPPDSIPNGKKGKSASTIIEGNGKYPFTPLKTERRALATLERAERAMAELGKNEAFLLVYYGSDHAGGWQPLTRPLRTLTTLDRFALVKPTKKGHVMRMLQVPELKAAMGMPKRFRLDEGTRREHIKLIGNAVCPPVMRTVIRCIAGAMQSEQRKTNL